MYYFNINCPGDFAGASFLLYTYVKMMFCYAIVLCGYEKFTKGEYHEKVFELFKTLNGLWTFCNAVTYCST